MVTGIGDGMVFTVAPIDGIENIPATKLPAGVSEAFAFFSPPPDRVSPTVPTGFYTLRMSATSEAVSQAFEATTQGKMPPADNAKVEFIDRSGNVAAKLPASLQVTSMVVPDDASRARNFVNVSIQQSPGNSPGVSERGKIICIVCSNGYMICFRDAWDNSPVQ